MTSAAKWKGWSDSEWVSISSSFPRWYLHAHSHIINTHAHPARTTRTLKHEMNMSGVNFDWHFCGAPKIYSVRSAYQNELPANKKNKKWSRPTPIRWSNAMASTNRSPTHHSQSSVNQIPHKLYKDAYIHLYMYVYNIHTCRHACKCFYIYCTYI